MNKRLPEEIFTMLQKLEKPEYKAFESYANKKSPLDGKDHKYIKLLKLYLKQVDELELDEERIVKEAKKITSSLPDLNQKLHEELIKFIVHNWSEKSSNETEQKISELLDTSIALFQKGLFNLSASKFLDAITMLKEIQNENMKESLLYLSLKAYSLFYTIRWRAKLNDAEVKEFDSFQEFIHPFSQIARNVYSVLLEKNRELSLRDQSFDQSTFYSLLNIYFRERNTFENTFKDKGNHNLFPIASLLKGRYKNYGNEDKTAEKAEDSLIDAESFLFQIERLYSAVVANDSMEFDRAFDSIRHKLFPSFSLPSFNADLLLFVYRQMFELKTIFTLQNNEKPNDYYELRELEKISREKIGLFHKGEVKDFALRVELNSFVILFLEGNYGELLDRISEFEKSTKKDIYQENYIDVRLMDIICRFEAGGVADEELDKRIKYYETYTKRYNTSEFHKKFDGFLKMYLNAASGKERKEKCIKYLSKIEKSKETFNHFQVVFTHWLKNKT